MIFSSTVAGKRLGSWWAAMLVGCATAPPEASDTDQSDGAATSDGATTAVTSESSTNDAPATTSSPTTAAATTSGSVGDSGSSGADDQGSATSGLMTSGGDGSDSSTGGASSPSVGPFVNVRPVDGLNVPGVIDDDPTLRADMLEIYFASNRDGDERIFRSTRDALNDPWDPPVVVFSGPGLHQSTPELSHNGLVITFAGGEANTNPGYQIYYSTRSSVDATDWTNPVELVDLNTEGDDAAAVMTADLLTVFYTSPGLRGPSDIFTASRPDTSSAFTGRTEVDGVSSLFADQNAWVNEDASLMILVTRDAAGADIDIVWANDAGGTLELVGPVEGVNTGSDDNDPWLSRDGSTFYFARLVGTGDYDIFVADRQ